MIKKVIEEYGDIIGIVVVVAAVIALIVAFVGTAGDTNSMVGHYFQNAFNKIQNIGN